MSQHTRVYGPSAPTKFSLRGIRFVEGEGGAQPAEPPAEPPAQEDKTDWKAEARKWESRAKENNSKLEQFEQQSKSEAEKAIDKAREEGRAEIRTVLARERVSSALTRALEGRLPNTAALLDLDRDQFVNGDGADVTAIKTWVDANSTEATSAPRTPDLGQGRDRGQQGTTKGVGAGADLFANRKKSPTT